MPLSRLLANSGARTQRHRVVLIAGILAILAAIVPLIGIAAYARHSATQSEISHVVEYSEWTLKRAETSLAAARSVLTTLNDEGWNDCSPGHIARMRVMAVEGARVEEVGFVRDGKLACTSWGPVPDGVAVAPATMRLPDGTGLDPDVAPQVPGASPLIAISRGHHRVLMPADSLVDVLTDTTMALGIADLHGRLIATTGALPADTARQIARQSGTGRLGPLFHASSQSGDLRAFAVTDQSLIAARVDRDMWWLLPISLAISAILLGLIIWISRQSMSPEGEFASGMRKGEFFVCYQPIIDLSTGACVGAEALLRWTRPNGNAVPPDLFIPFAEQHRLIEPLTDMLIDYVVADLAEMLRSERGAHITINISAQDMESGRFLPVLHRALAETSIDPSQIWLEATERGFMDPEAAQKTLEAARAQGHFIAIDDFGTGYSSLSMLEQLPLDTLKIDKSFVDAIGKDTATSPVIPHIIEIAHGLQLNIVAEGVETAEQEAYLQRSGVEFAQGWLYSRPLPAAEFMLFFQNHRPSVPIGRPHRLAS